MEEEGAGSAGQQVVGEGEAEEDGVGGGEGGFALGGGHKGLGRGGAASGPAHHRGVVFENLVVELVRSVRGRH